MKRAQLIGIVLCGTSLTACTTSMETRPVPTGTKAVYGTQYSLPALELEFAMTRRLVDCSPPAKSAAVADSSANPQSVVNQDPPQTTTTAKNQPVVPEFEFKVDPKQEFVASETFAMDYSSLSKTFKTSAFKIDWHDNGMIKSFNVEATDKGGEIALEALKAGIAIAKLAGGIPSGGGARGTATPACPIEVETRKGLMKNSKTASDMLAQQTAIVESYQGRDNAILSETEKGKLNDALNEAKKQTKAIADINKKLAELDKVLAFTETVRWRPPASAGAVNPHDETFRFEIPQGNPATIEEAARAKWVKRLFGVDNLNPLGRANDGCETVDENKDGNPDSFLCRLERSLAFTVRLLPEPVNSGSGQLAETRSALGMKNQESNKASAKRDHVRGVVTRMPVRSRFYGCSGIVQSCHRASPEKLFDQLVSVPQFGHYLILPFSNGFGEDNQLTVNFSEAGAPTLVDYKHKKAAALTVAQTVNQGAGLLLGYAADVRAFRKAEKEKEEGAALKALESEVKLLEQQKKIVELQAAIDPGNAALAQEKTRLEKELAIAQAERDIAKVQNEREALELQLAVAPDDLALEAEKNRLATQEAVLRSRAGILKLCTDHPALTGCDT